MSEKIIEMELEKLIPYARNPRKNDHAVDRIASAIREFGFKVPVIAKSDGTVVDGHLRLKAAQKLGMGAVPVLLADDLSDAQIKAFRLSVNKMAELAEWDDELLHLELDELRELDFDLDLAGFDDDFGAVQILDDFPEIKDKPDICQITFSLSRMQADFVNGVISDNIGKYTDPENKNRNGNALYYVLSKIS